MPVIVPSSYIPPPGFRNGHIQTLFAALARRIPAVTTEHAEIRTADGEVIDLERNTLAGGRVGTRKLAILTHGLEGSARQAYVQGMARVLDRAGWEIVAWNLRGCGDRATADGALGYHSGSTGDLGAVVDHFLAECPDYEIALVGFSLGGNITLKYLGDAGGAVDKRLRGAVAFSVPCDLGSCADRLAEPANRIYMNRFLRALEAKVSERARRGPGGFESTTVGRMRTFHEFDEHVTAPLHGFASAEDYWSRCSSKAVLHRIAIPTLLVNARNDPMLGPACFPDEIARANPNFFLEAPASGGHIGFVSFNRDRTYWSESRALSFLENGDAS